MDGNTVETIYWGDTPEEVYEKCKSIIDPLYEAGGYEEMDGEIKGVAGSVCYNKKTYFPFYLRRKVALGL